MKKFLTVLLALSVVFTYTVGTAFAAAPTTKASEKDPYEIGRDMVDAKASSVRVDAAKAGVYDSAAVETAIDEATRAGYAKVQALYEEYIENKTQADESSFYASLEAWLDNDETSTDEFDDVYGAAVVEEDYAIKIAAAKALVAAVNPADYIDEDQKSVADYKVAVLSALDAVKAVETGSDIIAIWRDDVTVWKNTTLSYRDAINVYLYGAGANFSPVYKADDKLADVITGTENPLAVKGLFVMLSKLTTVTDKEENDQITDAYIQNIIANITFNAKAAKDGYYLTNKVVAGDAVTVDAYGEYYGVKVADPTKITAAEATSINNALMAAIDETLEVLAVRVQWVADEFGKTELDNQVKYYKKHGNFKNAMKKAHVAQELFAKVVAYGAELKDAVNYAGDKKYNDADIDKAIEDAKYKIFGGYYEAEFKTVEGYFDGVIAIYDDVAVAIKVAVEKWQPTIKYYGDDKTAEADKKYCADFYAGNPTVAPSSVNWQKKYETIKADAIDALYDAKTIEEVEAIMADADARLAKLRTNANDNATLGAEINKYIAALGKYAAEQYALVAPEKTYLAESYNEAKVAGVKVLKAVAEKEELAGAYEEAKALFNDIKDKATLKAEAEAVQKAIIALPTTAVRIENEDAYMGVYDAYKAYLENYGATKADVKDSYSLEKAMGNLKALQEKAVIEAIRDMNADKEVTRAEYEAVKAMYDRYADYYDQYNESFGTKAMKNDITVAKTTVWKNEVAAVKKMIAKLTTNSPVEDVLAAKAAYDALTGSQQRAVMHEFGTAWTYKLELMQTVQIKAVESMKVVKNHSVVGKGYIKIAWSTIGDETAIDGFKVYKSTKANSGYKYTFTTANKTYKNTKGLKKGTRYYYKVRAYKVVDGKTYYSDYSNKAYRVAK